jgi:hypothetical protein
LKKKKSVFIGKYVPVLGIEELFNMAGHYTLKKGERSGLWSRLGIQVQHVIYSQSRFSNGEKIFDKTIEVCSPKDVGFVLNCRNIFRHGTYSVTQHDMEKLWSRQMNNVMAYLNAFCNRMLKTDAYFQSYNLLYWSDDGNVEIDVNVDRSLYLIYLFTTNITISATDDAILILLHPGKNTTQLLKRLNFLHNQVSYPQHFLASLTLSQRSTRLVQPMNASEIKNTPGNVQMLQQEEFHILHFIIKEYTSSFYGSNRYDDDDVESGNSLDQSNFKSTLSKYIHEYYELFVKDNGDGDARVDIDSHLANSDLLTERLKSFSDQRLCTILQLIDHNRTLFAKINSAIRMERHDKENPSIQKTPDEHIADLILSAIPQDITPKIAESILKTADPQISGDVLVHTETTDAAEATPTEPPKPLDPQESTESILKDVNLKNVGYTVLLLISIYGFSKSEAWARVKEYLHLQQHGNDEQQRKTQHGKEQQRKTQHGKEQQRKTQHGKEQQRKTQHGKDEQQRKKQHGNEQQRKTQQKPGGLITGELRKPTKPVRSIQGRSEINYKPSQRTKIKR